MKEGFTYDPLPSKTRDRIRNSPRLSPRPSPRASPRLSPRASPRLSPRPSPRLNPRMSRFELGGPAILPPPEPAIGHGRNHPGLLPNEVLLQDMGRQLSKYEKSEWIRHLRHQAQIKCPKCILLSQLHSWVIDGEGVPLESDNRHLRSNTYRGRLYLTTERLIFVPRKHDHPGYSIYINMINMLKVTRDHSGQPYLLCYVEDRIATLPFFSMEAAQGMLRKLANIRFEHMLRLHVTPEYDLASPPSYESSQESIGRLLQGHLPDVDRSSPEFKKLIESLGSGDRRCFIDPDHNGYFIGPKAHAVKYEDWQGAD